MQSHIGSVVLMILSISSLVGCEGTFSGRLPSMTALEPQTWIPKDTRELAGPWEYQDESGQGILVLDQAGKGSYDWKDGWFETDSLKDGVWKGKWYQAENDREGGFEVKFTTHSSIVRGHWWYTRIESDVDPLEPGGTMTMKRPTTFLHSGK